MIVRLSITTAYVEWGKSLVEITLGKYSGKLRYILCKENCGGEGLS